MFSVTSPVCCLPFLKQLEDFPDRYLRFVSVANHHYPALGLIRLRTNIWQSTLFYLRTYVVYVGRLQILLSRRTL